MTATVLTMPAPSPDPESERRWLVWRYEVNGKLVDQDDEGKARKPPVDAAGRKDPDWNKPASWLTYKEAQARCSALGAPGVGFVLGDGWGGLDLDDCVDPETGELTDPRAAALLKAFVPRSRAEHSPSGKGLKVVGRAARWLELGFAGEKVSVRVSSAGYFTMTGKCYRDGTHVEEIPVDAIAAYFGAATVAKETPKAKVMPPVAEPGTQNSTMFTEMCALRRRNYSAEEIAAAVWKMVESGRFPAEAGKGGWTERDVRDMAERVVARYPGDAADSEPITDPRNAEHFKWMHGDRAKYDADRRRWVLFNGHRWEPDALAKVRLLVLEALRARQAAAVASQSDDRKKRLAQLLVAENRVPQILGAAEAYLGTRATDWDADTWLVGAPNGTVDLRSGEVRSGRPEDRITKQLGAPWDLAARSDLWESVLARALPDREVRDFLQQLAGLTLAGLTGENALPVMYGVTRSSKGTILDALRTAMGDYAKAADLSTLARRRFEDGGAPRPDLVDLVGARLVAIYEAGRRFKLDTALVKTLSGSDPIKARTLHEKPIEFRPTFLIWLATDTRPEVPDDDAAFYERLCELPFNVYLEPGERDPGVRERLKAPEHGTAVLAWAWCGLEAYLEAKRLVRPRAVEDAGRAFREAMDPVRPFLDAACVFKGDAWASASDIRGEYERWCRENGERPVTGKRMAEALRKNGCAPAKRGEVRGWAGVGLLSPTAGASGFGTREPGGDDGIPF